MLPLWAEIAKAVGAKHVDVRIVSPTDLHRLQRAIDLSARTTPHRSIA